MHYAERVKDAVNVMGVWSYLVYFLIELYHSIFCIFYHSAEMGLKYGTMFSFFKTSFSTETFTKYFTVLLFYGSVPDLYLPLTPVYSLCRTVLKFAVPQTSIMVIR